VRIKGGGNIETVKKHEDAVIYGIEKINFSAPYIPVGPIKNFSFPVLHGSDPYREAVVWAALERRVVFADESAKI
jgi:hypothetical protein